MSPTESSFRGKVGFNAQESRRSGAQYGHLILPKGVSIFKETPGGRARLDIVPYKVTDMNHLDRHDEKQIALPGTLWYKRPFRIHRNVGGDGDSAVCLSSIRKKCPICEYRAERTKKNAAKEETDALRASLRNLYAVIPREMKDLEEKPYIWDISQFLFQELLTEELRENEAYEIFPDLQEGLPLRIRFESKTLGGNSRPFADASRIDFEERDFKYDNTVLEAVPSLDEVLKIYSYDELERKFLEVDPEEEEEKSDEEPHKAEPSSGISPAASYRQPIERKAEPSPPERAPAATSTTEGMPRRRKTPVTPVTPATENPCPHGFKFGTDCETKDQCNACVKWDDCVDEKDKLDAAQQTTK